MSAYGWTVYDEKLEVGALLTGGMVFAAVFETKDQADAVLAGYRSNRARYDVRPATCGAVAAAAMEIAERMASQNLMGGEL